ncbi:LysM domain-containing protein [Streptococcus sp. sy010]|uniref:LysM peptidoglycan-binding domain-containing protein n=1 Tax=Streptococcus sp. sy010 TaxID=2600148 RepID=UPI0011B658C3|nr:LysM domain-containing protein [Streptococcus sp. sy010]TWT14270.1 LysM peptidoglycan-binding domain-containing protein [Streptococcus sp. sy010]
MSKNFIKKSLLLSTMALSIFGVNQVQAEEGLVWTPRSVEEIRAGLVKENNKITYTVQYGDTLGSIAEAVGLEVNVLANLNNIADANFILPNTVLTITYDNNQDVKTVQVDVPQTSATEEMTVKADLMTNEVILKDQTVKVSDLKADPANQVVQTVAVAQNEVASQVVTTNSETPVVEQSPEVSVPTSETIVSETVSETSSSTEVTENTSVETETTVVPVESATSETVSESEEQVFSSEVVTSETVSESSDSSEATENLPVETEMSVETPSSEVVASDVVETPNVEEVTQSIVESSETNQSYAQTENPVEEAVTQVVEASTEQTPAQEEVVTPAESTVPEEQPVTEIPTEQVETPVEEVAQDTTTNQTLTYNSAGMQAKTAAFQSQVGNEFGISDIGGYRNSNDDHGQGLAVDIMVDSVAQGDQVAQYAVDNIANNDISYVIWQQRFYSPVNNIYGPANTWNLMPDRGSATQNHMDHVHVSMNE